MDTMNSYFTQAELALAAYSNLYRGMSETEYKAALQNGDGLSKEQAQNFASRYTVIDQYDGMFPQTYFDDFGQEHTILLPTHMRCQASKTTSC